MAVGLDQDVLLKVARAASGEPNALIDRCEVHPSVHRVENMTTHSLDRVVGTLVGGAPWSAYVKSLQPASASPAWELIPFEFHQQVLEDLNWLDEPRVYRSGLSDDMPDGLRLPELFHVDEREDRITLWLEDVPDLGGWDLDRYHRAAAGLGRLGGRWPEARAVLALGMVRRPLERLFFGKIVHHDLALQAPDAFWDGPAIAAVVDGRHREDLEWLRRVVPDLLRRVAALPHGLAHGDATPDNLREPGDGSVVAIDWSYGSCSAFGGDLGQLMAGRVESGAMHPRDLPAVSETIVTGYVEGLAEEGLGCRRADIELAFSAHLAVRSVFSALILDHRPDLAGEARQELLARRAALGRFGLDLVGRACERSLRATSRRGARRS